MKVIRQKWKLLLLAGAGLALAGFLPFYSDIPAQPIDFSHRIHAEVNQIPCQYCHIDARRSPFAGLPPESRCMGCHKIIATDNPEVAKLKDYYDKGESIPWVKMFVLPDFAYFRHQPHIQRGLRCQTCHGEVQTIDRFREVAELQMGWCINCHREKQAPTDCFTCHR